MGDAIARLREAALAIRRHKDEYVSEPWCEVEEYAVKRLSSRCRHLLREFEAGRLSPERYARELLQAKRIAERSERLSDGNQRRWAYVEWLPSGMKAKPPSNINPLAIEAAKEALMWGPQFPLIESRIRLLCKAVTKVREGIEYSGALAKWLDAYDALAPFESEPPAPAATSEKNPGGTKQKKRRDRKGVGGRPERYSLKFIREVVAARERDEKQAAKAKQPLLPFPRWLREYCDGHSIDIREQFPPSVPGEAWNIRASRFWKAAKARLSRSGN
jgi:hypothetical protein